MTSTLMPNSKVKNYLHSTFHGQASTHAGTTMHVNISRIMCCCDCTFESLASTFAHSSPGIRRPADMFSNQAKNFCLGSRLILRCGETRVSVSLPNPMGHSRPLTKIDSNYYYITRMAKKILSANQVDYILALSISSRTGIA